MRELIDDLYLFSRSAESFGEVIAERMHNSADTAGKNLFDILGIDSAEIQFLNLTDVYGNRSLCAVVGNRDREDRIVLIDLVTSFELPLGLAMEISRPCAGLGAVLDGRSVRISPSAQKLIDEYALLNPDPAIDMSVSASVVSLLEFAQAENESSGAWSLFSEIFSSIAELVCLPIECAVTCDSTGDREEEILLHWNACKFTVLAMAMAARRYSPERRLCALISFRYDFVSMSLAYECGDVAWSGESLFAKLIEDGDTVCEICTQDGRKFCSMAPCYFDEGLIGVKERMSFSQMLEFWR